MSNAICVGGLVIENNRYVRLLNPGNYNQPRDTNFSVGEIWNIDFEDRNNVIPPHIEDVIILNKKFFCNLDVDYVGDFLTRKNLIDWNGHIDNLFEGKIKWTNRGSGYINKENVPKQSVGFWISDKELTKKEIFNNIRYNYTNSNGWRSLKFVGIGSPIDIIPVGTILRVSLARWWKQEGNTEEERCYLQLSGWYLKEQNKVKYNDDLPF